MKQETKNKPAIIVLSKKDAEMQKVYLERLEKFLLLAEMSYRLKTAPKIYPKKC